MLPVTLLVSIASVAFGQQQPPQEKENEIRERWEFFYNQRAYPTGRIPSDARANALRQAAPLRPLGPGSSSVWTLVGPRPTMDSFGTRVTSGHVSALAVNPTNASIIHLGAACA